ncbi:MAG: hypothetical protein AAGB22_07355, partial [Bacteroidota bacterium]
MKLRYTTLLIALLLGAGTTLGQNVEFKASNFKEQNEALKTAVNNIKSGDEFYELGTQAFLATKAPGDAFHRALSFYLKAQEFNPSNAELNLKIGFSYLNTNTPYLAKTFIEKSFALDAEGDPLIFFCLGQVYQKSMDFNKAISNYKKFQDEAKSGTVDDYKKFTSQYIKECKHAKEIAAKKLRVWVDNVEEINSAQDDYSPSITADGELLIFTSERANGHTANDLGHYDADIYMASAKGRQFSTPKNAGAPLNSETNDLTSGLAYDGQRIMIAREQENNLNILESKLKGTNWSEPEPKMSSNVNNAKNQWFASYDPGDNIIYYTTDENPPGGNNIYYTGKIITRGRVDNRWGKGTSVSHVLNTKFHEATVYAHPDGQTIYFSSQGHNSMGGYDIYKSVRRQGQWTPPVNMGYPINTPYDDLFFAGTANGKFAYIASNREGGKGGLDIYKVTFWGPEKPVFVDTEDYLLASAAEPIKEPLIAKAVEVENASQLTVFKGRVIDALTRKPVEAAINITDNAKGEVISSFASNAATGKFLLSLPAGRNYGISLEAEGYLFHSENFNLPE